MIAAGTLPAIPSPLTENGRIDHDALAAVLERIFTAGVAGVVVAGTSGEGVSIDQARQLELVKATCEVGGRHTIIAGCAGNSVRTILSAIEVAANAGVQGVLVPPPYYYPASDASLISFYTSLAKDSPVPLLLYHIPARTQNRLSISAIRALSELEGVAGIKDSGGQALFHLDLLALQHDGFVVFQGDAPLVGWSYMHGAAGSINPVSALFPNLELALHRSVASGDLDGVRTNSQRMSKIAGLLRLGDLPLVTNLKAIGELLGLMQRWAEPPLPSANDEHLQKLQEALQGLGDWASEPSAAREQHMARPLSDRG